ncbi:DNA glycosylase [Piedraia hortae CBS 480.64]|uniref:DNA glycosylase n=1 Tax=Piedraia hortae CBS 480.64 TaxID=1314780 RepID=A0A6A7C6P0_9PEZI|nr:DNA glycosylase [Piedraia hortae CBS 480.64]
MRLRVHQRYLDQTQRDESLKTYTSIRSTNAWTKWQAANFLRSVNDQIWRKGCSGTVNAWEKAQDVSTAYNICSTNLPLMSSAIQCGGFHALGRPSFGTARVQHQLGCQRKWLQDRQASHHFHRLLNDTMMLPRRSLRVRAINSAATAPLDPSLENTNVKQKPVAKKRKRPVKATPKAVAEVDELPGPKIPKTNQKETLIQQQQAIATPQSDTPNLTQNLVSTAISKDNPTLPDEAHEAPHLPPSLPVSDDAAFTNSSPAVLDQACAHLIRQDSRFVPLIARHACSLFSASGLAETINPFQSLVSGIIGQQVSTSAARSIRGKFIALFPDAASDGFPTPAQVAEKPIPDLRPAGLSQRKAEYISGLAQRFVNGELTADLLTRASDAEVRERLIAVRGLGEWSVHMFMCFGLKRLDIWATGDLGVQRGVAQLLGRNVKNTKAKGKWKFVTEKEMVEFAEPYRPYRSLLMWYLWKLGDMDVDVLSAG